MGLASFETLGWGFLKAKGDFKFQICCYVNFKIKKEYF